MFAALGKHKMTKAIERTKEEVNMSENQKFLKTFVDRADYLKETSKMKDIITKTTTMFMSSANFK